MKKKLLSILMVAVMVFALTACGGGSTPTSSDDSPAAGTPEDKPAAEKPEDKVYGVGDTWTVDGLFKVTINSVTPTDERNQFHEAEVGAVYIINYTYENIGLEDEVMDGLYISFDMGQIVDSAGTMGSSYPSDLSSYPKAVPVGANHTAEVAIGVVNPGPFTINYSVYDSDFNEYKAKFKFEV